VAVVIDCRGIGDSPQWLLWASDEAARTVYRPRYLMGDIPDSVQKTDDGTAAADAVVGADAVDNAAVAVVSESDEAEDAVSAEAVDTDVVAAFERGCVMLAAHMAVHRTAVQVQTVRLQIAVQNVDCGYPSFFVRVPDTD